MSLQRDASASRETVWQPSSVCFKRLDQTVLHQPADRGVQGAGLEPHPGELLDILGQPVPVLGAASQLDKINVAGPA